jgi:hypothetical protein
MTDKREGAAGDALLNDEGIQPEDDNAMTATGKRTQPGELRLS